MELDTVLVTGGAGFIGHHLTSALLSQGRKVKVLDDFSSGTQLPAHPLLTVIQGDMSESSVREEALHQIKSVINLLIIMPSKTGTVTTKNILVAIPVIEIS